MIRFLACSDAAFASLSFFKEMNFSAYELLYEWEKQNIIARLIKFDKENIKTGNTRRQKYNRESKIN